VGSTWLDRLVRETAGQSMVETALLLPILVFALIGGADLARAYSQQLAVQNGARAGAEAYALSRVPSASQAQNQAIAEINRTPGITVTTGNVTVTPNLKADGSACTPPTTIAVPCYVTVRVQFTFRTIIAWPMIPNTANFDRKTTIRQFN
jgi:Flp pilus assembly protein TadG